MGEQRLSEHICLPREEDPKSAQRLTKPRRSSVSPPSGESFQFMSGDELISSARSVTDDDSEVDLAEFVASASLVTRPSTPTRIMGLVDYDLGVHFDGIFIPAASPDRRLAGPGENVDISHTLCRNAGIANWQNFVCNR